MIDKNKKIRVTLTVEELGYLEHILWHFTDYMAKDDRPDHGLGILKGYRERIDNYRHILFPLAGRLRRLHRKQHKI